MQLILVPVPVLCGIDLQNPHPSDADFSRLCHIPSHDTTTGCLVGWLVGWLVGV